MALSGNLGFVPLEEVLRLLARAGQMGALEIEGESINGRVFFSPRGIDLATTFADHDLRDHLVNSQYVAREQLIAAESDHSVMETVAADQPELVDLLREMTVESIYQLSHSGTKFEVAENVTSPYGAPSSFDLESVLSDASRRADEWAEVEALLSDMAGVIHMKRDLGERDEVTVSRDAWKLLSELRSGSSVSEMAARLGTTEFWTAKVAADLTARDLLTPNGSPARGAAEERIQDVSDEGFESVTRENDEVATAHEDPVAAEVSSSIDEGPFEGPAFDRDEPEEGQLDEVAVSAEPDYRAAETQDPVGSVDDSPESDVNHSESWWVEPGNEGRPEGSQDDGDDEPTDERRGRLGVFASALNEDGDADASAEDVEEDTEAFLEKVFSQLDESEQSASDDEDSADDDDPAGNSEYGTTGHGLLRRRRLGTILTDTSKTSD